MNVHIQSSGNPCVAAGALDAVLVETVGVALGLGASPPDLAREFAAGLAPWQEKRVARYIVQHATNTIQVRDLAAIARLSVSHFSRAFRSSFGAPPYALVCRYRVREAMRLMLITTWPLVEIADACGFADQSHFTRTFQRHADTSPGRWRRLRRSQMAAS